MQIVGIEVPTIRSREMRTTPVEWRQINHRQQIENVRDINKLHMVAMEKNRKLQKTKHTRNRKYRN